jgi:HK97 family phage major capsid protein
VQVAQITKSERGSHPKSAASVIATTSIPSHKEQNSMSYLDKVVERRDAVKAEMDAILDAVAKENRTDLTAEETEKVDALVAESRSLDEKIEKLSAQAAADKKAAEARAAVASIATPTVATTKVTREERTYRPDGDISFFKDAYAAQFKSDYAAQERLARHQREESVERRDVGTDQFAGLVIPQYLVDLAAPLARAGRPFADFATNKMTLPPAGMTLNISRMTTGSSTAVQVTQNDAVSETDVDDTLLTVNVRTIAGQQDLSRQAIERGTGIDSFVAADLIKSWHTTLDSQTLNGTGSAGQIEGLRAAGGNAITFTSTAPTVALLYPKLADAIQQIQTNAFVNPTHFIMHPRRLAWLLSAVDSSNRPLVVPSANGPFNAAGVGAGASVYGNSGYQMMGLPIITDANIGTTYGTTTNRDEIYVVTAGENHLWEQPGSPFTLRYDATGAGNLTIKTVVYGYAAFTAGRYPLANSIISGSGLAAPTF